MAAEFPLRPLGEIAENYDRLRVPVRKKDRQPGPYPYYGASGIADYVDEYIFDGEYLLIAEDGENLRTRNTPIAFMADGKFWVNNHAHIIRGNGHADTRYLCHVLQLLDITPFLSGSTRPKLTQRDLKRIQVPCPPLVEQRRIAAILGALDDKIELNRKMSRTLEEMAQAIFKSWFIDFDGHDPADLVASELGPIPRGWRAGRLTDLQREGKYATTAGPFGSKLTRKHYTAFGVPVIRGVNLGSSHGWFHDDGFVYVSEDHAATLKSNMAYAGDVLFTQRGTLGQVGLIPDDPRFPRYVLSQSQMKLTCSPSVPPAFVYLLFSLPSTVDYIKSNAVASGVPHINLTFLRGFPVVVPDDRTLRRFGQLVTPLMRRITANTRENATLADLRDTLLPKLISGELHVPQAETAIEAVQ